MEAAVLTAAVGRGESEPWSPPPPAADATLGPSVGPFIITAALAIFLI